MRRAWYLLLVMALLRCSDDGGPASLDHLIVDLGDGSLPDRAASDGPRDGAGDGPGVTDLTQAPDGGSPTADCPKLLAATGVTVQVQWTQAQQLPGIVRWGSPRSATRRCTVRPAAATPSVACPAVGSVVGM